MMAIFSKKDEKKEDSKAEKSLESKSKKKEKKEEVKQVAEPKNVRLNDIIISPRITEKAVRLMDKGVYTFEVRKDANKTEVAKAIKDIYGVEPLKVNISKYPSKTKRNFRTGKLGKKSGGKKAIVYLKEGDKISII